MTNNNINIKNNKEIKYKHLNNDDRVIIAHILKQAKIINLKKYTINPTTKNKKYFLKTLKYISTILNKSTKTIKREIVRGTVEQLDSMYNKILIYSKDTSQYRYIKSIKEKKISLKIENNEELIKDIVKLLNKKYSPYAIIVKLSNKHKINFSLQTLYNYIHNGLFEKYGYKKESNTIIYKSKANHTNKKKIVRIGGLSIDERPKYINNRDELGHWEIDSVVGLREGSDKSIMTLTERKTRVNIVCLLASKTNNNVIKELKKIIKSKKYLIKSITSDNGSEFSNVKDITSLGVDWYFAHPYCSNERGSNENNNKMVRRFIPKGKSMNHLTKKDVKYIETFMNNYPRKIFNNLTSNQVYESLVNLT